MSFSTTTAENDAEDVNDFLKRIQELGNKRDQEDEERNRKLEEEILQGRKERQARRAERARSISPTKDSPFNTPQSFTSSTARLDGTGSVGGSPKAVLSQVPDLRPLSRSSTHEQLGDDDTESLINRRAPTKEYITGQSAEYESMDRTSTSTNPIKASPSSAMPSRNPTLSWQQRRPTSQASDRPRSRPLSMVASENAARSPRATPEPSSTAEEDLPLTRNQIAQSLATKDSAWFKQTADCEQNSPAYRKNHIEDKDVMDHGQHSRVHLPGMSREVTGVVEGVDVDVASNTSRISSTTDNTSNASYSTMSRAARGFGSPVPQSSAQTFEPPKSDTNSIIAMETVEPGKNLAMSPAQGRISPERLERPSSPTKGMGGFVQSAMMKRSDSVSKRWSVTSPPGLSRGNTITSSRGTYDPTASAKLGVIMSPSTREPRPSGLSQENSTLSSSRTTSSHSNVNSSHESEHLDAVKPMKSAMTNSTTEDSFVRPSMPGSGSQELMKSSKPGYDCRHEIEATPPSSPTKATARWSPTKSSWLESALNKPDSPRPKTAIVPQQPAWMAEMNKVKQNGPDEAARSPTPTNKHEVNIGGLLRSPPMGGVAKPLSIGGLPAGFTSGNVTKTSSSSIGGSSIDSKDVKRTTEFSKPSSSSSPPPPLSAKPSAASSFSRERPMSPATGKIKPETPPKKDFRSSLKPRQPPPDSDKTAEPEFKNVIGQLRRTKTQNYVAPDELKGNILRGKAELNFTGGPKKTERKDEFKDAILKKKDDFKKVQTEGTGVIRKLSSSTQSSAVPEALVKATQLSRPNTATKLIPMESTNPEPVTHTRTTSGSPVPVLTQQTSAPNRLQTKEGAGSKMAARFNPSLAGILARGHQPTTDGSRNSSTSSSAQVTSMSTATNASNHVETGPELTHMTKARARGPRRKAPSATAKAAEPVNAMSESRKDHVNVSQIAASINPGQVTETQLDKSNILSRLSVISKDDADNSVPEPSSPKKLDLRRRSLFLQEAPKPEMPLGQSQILKPSSPTKAKAAEASVEKDSNSSDSSTTAVSTPGPKAQLYSSARSSPNLIRKSDLETPSPETTRKLTPAPLSPSKSTMSNVVPKTPTSPYKKEFEDIAENSPSFIKNAVALFGRSPAMPSNNVPVKPPIRFSTQADDNSAMTTARLRTDKSQVDDRSFLPSSRKLSIAPQPSTRPLPTPPIKPASLTPVSSRDGSNSPQSGKSDTSKILADFFGINDSRPEYKVDTAAVLASRADEATKIKSLRSQLFQLTDNGKKQSVPNHQERILFEGNMYLCSHSYGTLNGKKITEVYFWTGDDVPESVIEDAHVFAQREAKSYSGALIAIRQGKETPEFIEALGGIAIIRRGSSNKYDSLAPHILCGRRHQGQIVFDEVDFATTSLCSGFPYLISTLSGKLFLWKGKGSSIDELSCARLIGMDFGLTGEIEEVNEGAETSEFLKLFSADAKVTKSADHWRLKPNYTKYCARLFVSNGSANGASQISEIVPFNQRDISPAKVYILDAFFEIYIIVGSASNTQYNAFCTALLFAQEYGILAAGMEDRPFVPVSTVVLEGVPRDLKFVFRKWKDALSPTTVHSPLTSLSRGRSLRVVTLNAALDATQR